MNDIEQPVVGRKPNAGLPCLLIRAGILTASKGIQKNLSRLVETNAMTDDVAGSLFAIPDETLSVQRRVDVHITIVYMLSKWRYPAIKAVARSYPALDPSLPRLRLALYVSALDANFLTIASSNLRSLSLKFAEYRCTCVRNRISSSLRFSVETSFDTLSSAKN